MDKCLYLEEINENYWYCDHLEYEREYPDCTDCPEIMTRRMIREGRAKLKKARGDDNEM